MSYAASPALAKQIENGAPADVFISADLDWMDYVEQRKLIKAGTRANLLRNRLVLIAPADSKVQAEIKPGFPLAKLLGDGKLSMADPDSVPAGKYGKAALEKLGVWSSVESKVARGTMCARRSISLRAARRRWVSFIRPTPMPRRRCASSPGFPRTRTRRSFIPSPLLHRAGMPRRRFSSII